MAMYEMEEGGGSGRIELVAVTVPALGAGMTTAATGGRVGAWAR